MTRARWWYAAGWCLAAFPLAALPLAAQPKLLVNAQVDTRTASAGLESVFHGLLSQQPQPAWIGYSVPAVRNGGLGCEYVRDGFTSPGVVHLEPPDHAVVLLRVEAGAVMRIRSLSPDCEIDAGGLPVHWLTDVAPAQSVALLASLISTREITGDGALNAIAVHNDPSADAVLDRYLEPNQPETLRLRAVAWMGTYRGRHGFEAIKKIIAQDPDGRVRERAVTALASSREPESGPLLVSLARGDQNVRIREQAISALASSRRAGPATIDTLKAIIQTDHDLQVKRRAVSALLALPDGQGIPVLIEVVKTTQDPDVRKQAMNTLGSSRDPRATAFFEEVLKR
ncbi:MAG TPA: HEAT repeat domain-containing protein [Bryobacteraceae bacterium]|nr:HEAT repeat domain-containing protein [Bryobacteraceae bacterium]